jgi:hypothetical protein
MNAKYHEILNSLTAALPDRPRFGNCCFELDLIFRLGHLVFGYFAHGLFGESLTTESQCWTRVAKGKSHHTGVL